MLWIRLSEEAIADAERQARMRQAVNEANRRQNSRGLGAADYARDLALHCQGRLAERAVAQALDLQWREDVDRPHHGGDVGPYEVRSTKHRSGGLLLREDDPDDRLCFLVIVDTPRFGIAGAMLIGEGKRPQWWRADIRRPAWIVPQSALIAPQSFLSERV